MTGKRFNYHIDEVGIYYYVCDNTKKGDDRIILELDTKYDAMEVCDILNELHEDNQLLHKMNADAIDFMYDNFDLNMMFTDRDLNNICNEMGWELSEKGIKINQLEKENEQLKKVLGAILLEVKRDISNTNQTGEIRVFINPNSFNLISEVLRKYGALKEWYE